MILYNIKKQIIILANCQGEVINYMLNKYYSNIYYIKYYSNYEFILHLFTFQTPIFIIKLI